MNEAAAALEAAIESEQRITIGEYADILAVVVMFAALIGACFL
jgi:hypothetical protein